MPRPTKPRKYSEATWLTEHQMGGGTGLARKGESGTAVSNPGGNGGRGRN